jgi:U3 small nucleolar RNA-associated protein 7
MGVGHELGFSSIVVPGSGEANFDAFENNPYASKKQRQESEVHNLMEKLQPDSIALNPATIGTIDTATDEVKAKEKKEDMEAFIESHKKKEKRKNKMRGKLKSGNLEKGRQQHEKEAIRAKNKLLYMQEYNKQKKETAVLEKDVKFLDDIEFDPIEALQGKRQKTDDE